MIDRSVRNAVAEAMRHYLAGVSTNFALDDALFDLKSSDPAIDAIRRQVWLIYDDLKEHRHEGTWQITTGQREIFIRSILFLKSDFEYQWPYVPGWYRATRPLIWLLTLGFVSSVLDRQFEFRDIDNVWPFRSSEEVQEAKNDPKYLAAAT
jgi:hypothetical protein